MNMVKTPYWILERDVGTAFFRLRRTPARLESNDVIEPAARAIERALSRVDLSRLGLLVDLREGPPMRNDPEFQRVAQGWQQKMLSSFGRVAFLVKTPAGKLQMNRTVGALHPKGRVFDDEREAFAFLQVERD